MPSKKHIGFWLSLVLFMLVIPYSFVEWFDDAIPFSGSLYILCALSTLILVINFYYLKKKS